MNNLENAPNRAPSRATRKTAPGAPQKPTTGQPEGRKHKVSYMTVMPDGTKGKITREMTQPAIAQLLIRPDVVLLAVNQEAPVYYPYKKKKKK